jgi:hypothetical protein
LRVTLLYNQSKAFLAVASGKVAIPLEPIILIPVNEAEPVQGSMAGNVGESIFVIESC